MKFYNYLVHFIEKLLILFLSFLFRCFPLKKNRVLFVSQFEDVLKGNLKYVYEKLPSNFEKKLFLENIRYNKKSLKHKIKNLYFFSTSKYVMLDDYHEMTNSIKIKKNQEICQLWHASGAFKKFGYSHKRYKEGLMDVHEGYKKYTKVITSSSELNKHYQEAFGISANKVKSTGTPRTDLFFDAKKIKLKTKELYKKYPKLKNKKIILFAPTHRKVDGSKMSYDYGSLDFLSMYKRLGSEYICAIKWHPMMKEDAQKYMNNISKEEWYSEFVIDLTEYDDINELLLITNVLITDYSSVIFDYSLLNKPIIYYVYDLEDYERDKGLYYPFEEYVYGPKVKTFSELISNIKKPEEKKDLKIKFVQKFMRSCDGNSTMKTIDWIFESGK